MTTEYELDRHGTISRYIKRKCHCDLCRKVWREYMRAYSARKRQEARDAESRAS